ncbi:MAG: RNA polymerase II transcription factor B 52 kDa subunit, partial [Chrysothrix sp. TS-e1954]
EQLPGNQLKRLYRQPSTALAVFRRMLPHLAKTFVLAMLYMRDPLPVSDLDAWVRPESRGERDIALELLERLHILATIQDPGKSRAYRISKPFVSSLRLALTGGGNHQSFGVPSDDPDGTKVGAAELDKYARERWDGILYFIVGSTGAIQNSSATISQGSKYLLSLGYFVETQGASAAITQTGFSFLLQEVNTQIWSLLIVYLENAEKLQMDSIEVLSFLFTLGSLEVGQDYSTNTLSPTQLQMLDDLNDMGIVYRQSPKATRFYPTRLATTLNSDSDAVIPSLSGNALGVGGVSTDQKGFIIVETNYRIYAYTNSQLRIDILSLFAKLGFRYPNLVTGRLTKESIQRAISRGITSQQIISYLAAHAHPVMTARSSAGQAASQHAHACLPPTVVDQIRLWQLEGDRMKATSGFLFKEFFNYQQYKDCLDYADTIGVLVWKNEAKKLFFVTRHEQIASYLKHASERRTQEVNGTKQ